jgi:hydroxypyruvate isomerase
MLDFSVCIEMFWRDLPMSERVRRVKALGYKAFEFWGWKDKDVASLRTVRLETGLACAAMCMEPNWGLTDDTISDKDVIDGFVASLQAASALGCKRLICVPGLVVAGESWEITRRRVVRRARAMAPLAQEAGVVVVLEPLNPIVDHKGAWLTKMSEAADLALEIGSPSVKILDDLYHQQVTEGNLIANFTRHAALIGHVHCAGVPGRHELVGGELDFRTIFNAIKQTSYSGYVGLEFAPTKDGDAGLKEALGLI